MNESVQNDQAKVYIQWKPFGLHSKGPNSNLELKNRKMSRKRKLEVNSLAWKRRGLKFHLLRWVVFDFLKGK